MSSRSRMLATLLLAVSLAPAAFADAPPGAILRLGNGPEPESLDPQRSESVSAFNILRDLYEGLTAVGPDGAPIPAAARQWEVSADGLEYSFHLRPGLRWSNGAPLLAEDYAAALRRAVDPATGSSYAQVLTPIRNAEAITAGALPPAALGVTAPDALTLRIVLHEPAPYFPGVLAQPVAFPVYRPALEKYGKVFDRPGRLVGNGAYSLGEWQAQSHVTLRRNPLYWDDRHTRVDTVVYLPTEDLSSELQRYRAGDLDCTYTIPMSQADWVRRKFPAELHLTPYLGSYWYGYNLSRPPFQGGPGLRRALSLAVDRELIAGKLLQGAALPSYGLVPRGTWNYTPQRPPWADWPRAQRIAEARRLYAAAGYSEAHPLEVELRYNTQDDHRRVATLIAAMWKQNLGVQTRLVNEEWKVFLQTRRARKATEVFRGGWIGDYDDAAAFLDILRSFDGKNDEAYASAAYDKLLAAAGREVDVGRRRALLQQAEAQLLDDMPILPIYDYQAKHLVKPYVEGWRDNPLDVHYSKDLGISPH